MAEVLRKGCHQICEKIGGQALSERGDSDGKGKKAFHNTKIIRAHTEEKNTAIRPLHKPDG